MKHRNLVPFVILKNHRFSVLEIAKMVINFYKDLSLKYDAYTHINLISEKKPLYEYLDVNDSEVVEHLAEEILWQNIDDIRKINKINDPDKHFSRDEIISFGLEVKKDEETLVTLNYSFSTNLPRIGPIAVNQKCFDTFSKAKFFLEKIEKSFPIAYSTQLARVCNSC